jgi:hypothetical protein
MCKSVKNSTVVLIRGPSLSSDTADLDGIGTGLRHDGTPDQAIPTGNWSFATAYAEGVAVKKALQLVFVADRCRTRLTNPRCRRPF